ncbi:ATP-dependent DNA helicase [Planktothrix sp. FACHB-1355]|uniref:ATP-dependent DNA helicase n=1 Tax=Aerosakkonema funiforme FACHB-1375 TaxID=2949571 RepID=A0A926V9T2_9CYAN|nr:ATP-dependent DNA helicase [Aerosakkonema funiforme]MBD2179595.1 ATP-dependent DNA helicase [Aerosakkonema funiforme FACHB-1375]MBD3562241.1 ATP-dependent DNA helicase [Planktothrix sp. FACHB-1355]
MIEVEVHNSLRAFLRSLGAGHWPHHLTMARLVARALRLGRSALIQVGVPAGINVRYRLSYLAPALIWPGPVILVATESVQQRLLKVEIPQLLGWIRTRKAIRTGDALPDADFQGLLLTSPEAWLFDRLTNQNRFGAGIPTIVDGVDDLETWTRLRLTAAIAPGNWDELMLAKPSQAKAIRNARVQLTKAVFQHPTNPYECYPIEPLEQDILKHLYEKLTGSEDAEENFSPSDGDLPDAWRIFWQRFQSDGQLVWAEIARRQGQFSLYCAPVDVASTLSGIWQQQPVVLIGGALELEAEAPIYRQRLGLGELTCVKFSADRHNELIHLYLPDGLPMPNTPQFQSALLLEIRRLLIVSTAVRGLTVLLVSDMPLKAQVAATLAAEFGSRVQVEKTCLDENGILVTGWEFWLEYQNVLPAPHLLAIASLPIPSLENPLVAGRVAYYKQQRQDWFRLYLLPETLNSLARAIAPVRETQGAIALLDSRAIHRSYGQQVLAALSPFARIDYLDLNFLSSDN